MLRRIRITPIALAALALTSSCQEIVVSTAVLSLAICLRDSNVHVRVSSAEALGRIGSGAKDALVDLRSVSDDPALASQAAWAIARIEGREDPTLAEVEVSNAVSFEVIDVDYVTENSWRMFCGGPERNAVVDGVDLPVEWDMERGENIRWSAALGEVTYGTPVLADGRVYVGNDNERPRDPFVRGEQGILLALRESDGELLWQDTAPSLERGVERFLLATTSSPPLLADDRLYYITA